MATVVRTQVQLRPDQHRRLREEAFRRGISVSALLRELVDERLPRRRRTQREIEQAMAFVGIGRGLPDDIVERHDDYLAEIEP